MGMRELLGEEDSRIRRFQKASEGKSKEEVRELERSLLKPDVLPPFIGKRPVLSNVEQRTIKMIFETDEDVELFKQFFKISTFKEQNTRDLGPIVALVEAMARGALRYNPTTKTLNYVDDQDEEWSI